ncbi:endonuclease/exonuclease/phosphatase family protein [Halioxenophilus sp. WMMB6]|uniref:endonuclease/exonuclease/phosphatase family protein n=1 Tax=Halioxenophilus sp. WMMB6 TaxID=3073815 RepID=UPI00295EFB72|nr:endonuclease/exonuclease/phosphatase family protein [Halioxenophilus sp. WMMB6]
MLKIATFNVENLDDKPDGKNPILAERAPVLRRNLLRLDADILCLQEVHAQELPEHTSSNPKRNFAALDEVLSGTRYQNYLKAHTVTSSNTPYDVRNLLVLVNPLFGLDFNQYRNSVIDTLQYRKVTAQPGEDDAKEVTWERPILHAQVTVPDLGLVHILNLHLKSRLASNIPGQKLGFHWRSAAGWAEGYFLSSIKRVGQALEARILLDQLFTQDPNAKIIVCGDFNSEPGEVPVEAICGRVENTDNPDLRHTVLVPCSLGIAESIRYSHLHQGRGNLLDHMLISQALLPYFHSAHIHNENLHDESLPFASDRKYPESDHAPFLAEFNV